VQAALSTDYECFLSYRDCKPYLQPYLMRPDQRVLHVGCGNSPFAADLYDDGFHLLTNVDYSVPVIAHMRQQHRTQRSAMRWLVADTTSIVNDSAESNMCPDDDSLEFSTFPPASFDVIIDKGCLDAMADHDVNAPEAARTLQQLHALLDSNRKV
jgi:hypothetical protein